MRKTILAAALLALPGIGLAHTCDVDQINCTYWVDGSGKSIKDGARQCVRATHWSNKSAVEGCDEMPAPPPPPPPAPAPLDSDGDGVVDQRDNCPNTPRGVKVDSSGCPLDSDGDGVADSRDQCPNTRPGAPVDMNGCEIKPKVLMEVDLQVQFAFDSARVTSEYGADIQRVADFMRKNPEASVVIEGHTDSTGPAAYNQQLSQRRAEAVAAALVSDYGVEARRVTAKGFGESRPVADNTSRDGRKKNRRVVAVVRAMVEQ